MKLKYLTALVLVSICAVINWHWWGPVYVADMLADNLNCDIAPTWYQQLQQITTEENIHSFQLAYIDNRGKVTNCVSGYRNWNVPSSAINKDTRFPYASLTKIVTAAISIKVLKQHHIELNATVYPYITPNTLPLDKRVTAITFADLLTHRAGFDRALSGDPQLSTIPWCPEQPAQLAKVSLDFTPATRFVYSNLGYCLLGVAVEAITQQNYSEILKQHISSEKFSQLTQQYADNSDLKFYQDRTRVSLQQLQLNYPALLAAGGLTGTAQDLAWLIRQLILDVPDLAASPQQMFDCSTNIWRTCHGFGFYHYQQNDNAVMRWRDGSLPGITAFAAAMPDGSVLVLLSNQNTLNWKQQHDRLGRFFYSMLAELQ
jgi:D-alanyl-D-alanine carboxypeptidase